MAGKLKRIEIGPELRGITGPGDPRPGLLKGPGYVSNGHWLIRNSRVKPGVTCKRSISSPRAEKIVGTGRRHRVTLTRERYRFNDGLVAELYAGRHGALRVWLNQTYAIGLGIHQARRCYATVGGPGSPVTDAPGKRWTVALMGMRVDGRREG